MALVLGGGAARGMAHIGVIRWLEENRIPVDLVVGTSSGALVGALYATGVGPAEMESIVHGIDWNEIFRYPEHEFFTVRRKQDHQDYPVQLELGWRNGLTTAAGMNPGQRLALLLHRLTLNHSVVGDFDQLPIRYRCLATDLAKGEEVVLERGSLAEAVRASAAIPGVFTPVEIEGRLLADGGLLNNLPTDVADRLAAATIIAVTLTTLEEDSLPESLAETLDRTFSVVIADNVRRRLGLADILIRPDIDSFSASDYGPVSELIARGYQAAQAHQAALAPLSLDQQEWEKYQSDKRSRIRTRRPSPASLEILNGRAVQDGLIRKRLEPHLGRELDADSLESDLMKIYGWGRFERTGYRIFSRQSLEALQIRLTPKRHGPPFIRSRLVIDGASLDRMRFGGAVRITFLDLGGYGAEWRWDAGVGHPWFLSTEYMRPLGRSFFLAPRAFTSQSTLNYFPGRNSRVPYEENRSGLGADLGYGFLNRFHEIRAGFEISRLEREAETPGRELSAARGTMRSLGFRWSFDTLDSGSVPTRGIHADVRLDRFLAAPESERDFTTARLDFSGHAPAGRKGMFFSLVRAGTSFDRPAPFAQRFPLGGPLRLGSLDRDELRGSHFAYANAGWLRMLSGPSLLLNRIWGGFWLESGSAFQSRGEFDPHSAVSAGVILDSFLGPLMLATSWGEGGRHRIYFFLGPLF